MSPCRVLMSLLCATLASGLATAQPTRALVAPVPPGTPVRVGTRRTMDLRQEAAKAIDHLVLAYGDTDFSPLVAWLRSTTGASPNDVVPFLSLGHAYLNRFENGGSEADFLRALGLFEIPAQPDSWPAWENRWATSITLSHLMKGLLRLRMHSPDDAVLRTRVDVLWDRVERLAADEADRKLASSFPYLPYDSAATGDSKAEENAWEAVFLAWASGLYPDHPRSSAWEEKARLLASLSIVRPSDAAYFKGVQVSTVHEDFTLENHGLAPNPYYSVATLMLLRMGALAYRMTGRTVPAEFDRNANALYRKYRSYCGVENGRWVWTLRSDPVGDPALWPLPGLDEDDYVRSLVAQKLRDRALWLPTPPVAAVGPEPGSGLTPDSVLGRAIQNAKVAWYYLDGAYLWLDPGHPAEN